MVDLLPAFWINLWIQLAKLMAVIFSGNLAKFKTSLINNKKFRAYCWKHHNSLYRPLDKSHNNTLNWIRIMDLVRNQLCLPLSNSKCSSNLWLQNASLPEVSILALLVDKVTWVATQECLHSISLWACLNNSLYSSNLANNQVHHSNSLRLCLKTAFKCVWDKMGEKTLTLT